MARTSSTSFPYPATLNASNFVSLHLTSDNYLLWRTQMMALIESQELLGFLNGEYEMPQPRCKPMRRKHRIHHMPFGDGLIVFYVGGSLVP
ncbi:hypothetical protein COLO4_29141 [Corchorus olitorius]|uniref:Retrotransposon Copia-like N-terminal domain-containing protein n=1 Tax=Corchorus olitorius TaxID=93759 RepID=A0A1R3HG75_9ROSI|nr:hypothetical protein COLO4_29141 [Corchorus olitorius]